MTRVGLVFLIFFVISTLAYNNCAGGKFETINAIGGLANGASAQCREKIRSAAKASLTIDPQLCETAANYRCDLRHFRPEVSNGGAETKLCGTINAEACVPVQVYNYNTAAQQADAAAEDKAEGGSYNRDEAVCINTQILQQQVAVIQTEGSSVEAALEAALNECRQRSRP
jgi:hypothetical protein